MAEYLCKRKSEKSTVRVREKEIRILLRYIVKVNIDKVTSRMHQNILIELDNKEYAKTTIDGVHVTAGMIFKYAIKEKMRKDNPCVGAVVPVKKLTVEDIENNTIEEKYLEKDEIAEFLACS
jgi:site-specific recombinase XerD